MRTAATVASAWLFFTSPAPASELDAVEAAFAAEGVEDVELDQMRYAVEHHLRLGGDRDGLLAATRSAMNVDCRSHCLVFVVEALNMALRAEIPDASTRTMLDRALDAMATRRDQSPRCWTDIEQGAWMWVSSTRPSSDCWLYVTCLREDLPRFRSRPMHRSFDRYGRRG